ncbi:PEP-CTERM sorting domain-containing protein [Silvimonas amylolytica]|uniref:Ice-binding protein C-terminal domain-containing protein n=1 Tax=Silvimonas amylolytica TaxID=449663 RepID=A0ABQ2PKI0_9NEIS|nr:PEP-CTERM sorting domain-containing protein [Silvimonas amylolytica]GGP26112.1 hypothetical protein GCM10010971_19310 [Silvimonas amylolytica]
MFVAVRGSLWSLSCKLALAAVFSTAACHVAAFVETFESYPEDSSMQTGNHVSDGWYVVSNNIVYTYFNVADMSYGVVNGIPVAPAYSGTRALSLLISDIDSIRVNGLGAFYLASAWAYAPTAPQGATITAIGLGSEWGDEVGSETLTIPAIAPGQSPWVKLSFDERLASPYGIAFSSNVPLFMDNLKIYTAVPEPETWSLFGLGLLGALLGRKRLHSH